MTAESARGRPRDPRTQRAILAATRKLLSTNGYDQISIDSIAREADVSRPTVYRRWPSKAHVVFDAVFGWADDGDMLEGSASSAPTCGSSCTACTSSGDEPIVASATMGILADRHRDPALFIRTQKLLDEQTQHKFAALVRAGIEQGAVRPDVDVQMLYELLIGTSLLHGPSSALRRRRRRRRQALRPGDAGGRGE